jgi:hypothetical protein
MGNNKLKSFIKTTIREFLNENKHLNYDQLDLDIFTNRYIVGRWFSSESEAKLYLKSIIDKSDYKNINDFVIIKDEKDKSLKPYRIYPKPSNIELRRNEASKFIKRYGILSSKDLRYITYPLYAYVEYKHINKIKELGVLYDFKPIKKIKLNGVLSRFIKENGHTNTITGSSELKFYNYGVFGVDDEYSMSINDIKKIRRDVEVILNNFNNILGTDYYIIKTIGEETNESIKRGLLNKLDDKKYNPNTSFEKEYKGVSFMLERGNDEEEFLGVIEMESIDKPKMKGDF